MRQPWLVSSLPRGIIVSCQPSATSPWRGPKQVAALAAAAERGGAAAVRVDGPEAVKACRRVTSLPIIGIYTDPTAHRSVAITPTLQHALALVEAGADIVALDASYHARSHDGQDLATLIGDLKQQTGVPVMADVAVLSDGLLAVTAGADMVGSSTTGYADGATSTFPDLRLVEQLTESLQVPIIAERGYATEDHVKSAFQAGAYAVVIGSAITDPVFITARFSELFRNVIPRT
ncbi:N-acetylmannosamine-6-phosphate 2-epimerase [Demequina lutea]|nr:putative N-acetylmannosamine-6-phosphate 2-epimerase [Demequina lutea]